MSKSKSGDTKSTLFCSFCGKSQHEVKKLIAGPTVFICDECVELCMDIIREEDKSQLVRGDEYQLLDQLVVSQLGTSAPITQTLAALSQGLDEDNEDTESGTSLSQAVVERYMDLFGVGGLAEVNEDVTADSALRTDTWKPDG